MKTIEVYKTCYRCLMNSKVFTTAGFGRDLSQDYGQKYYVTEDGEAAVIDLINNKPTGMIDLDHYVEMLWQDFGLKELFDGTSSIRQAAWRYFADLSHNNRLWYFEGMKGHPVCGQLLMYDVEVMRSRRERGEPYQLYSNAERIGGEKITSELQPVTYRKWLGLTDTDKKRWMQQFLTTPAYYNIKNIDKPLFPHPFHPELSA